MLDACVNRVTLAIGVTAIGAGVYLTACGDSQLPTAPSDRNAVFLNWSEIGIATGLPDFFQPLCDVLVGQGIVNTCAEIKAGERTMLDAVIEYGNHNFRVTEGNCVSIQRQLDITRDDNRIGTGTGNTGNEGGRTVLNSNRTALIGIWFAHAAFNGAQDPETRRIIWHEGYHATFPRDSTADETGKADAAARYCLRYSDVNPW